MDIFKWYLVARSNSVRRLGMEAFILDCIQHMLTHHWLGGGGQEGPEAWALGILSLSYIISSTDLGFQSL